MTGTETSRAVAAVAMPATVLRADARHLPLPDGCVDLIVTSPPYWRLRSYTDGGVHYEGQLGSEPTWQEYIENLLDCTREWIRVLKPTGNLFVDLGDKYSERSGPGHPDRGDGTIAHRAPRPRRLGPAQTGIPAKSLMDLPHRYAIRCVDDLGLINRAEICWNKVNGLPESTNDRVRRSHEYLFHFTRLPRYYAAVDEIREPHTSDVNPGRKNWSAARQVQRALDGVTRQTMDFQFDAPNPLGKLPGSVWDIPSQPLTVPAHLGVDHFAAFPMELPRRLILGWSPPGVCTACHQGRRPVVQASRTLNGQPVAGTWDTQVNGHSLGPQGVGHWRYATAREHRGYACGCPEPSAPTRPAVVLDPFGGTGTTALVASVLGRHGITADLSADYCRLAAWRTTDPGERARAMQVPKPPPVPDGQEALWA